MFTSVQFEEMSMIPSTMKIEGLSKYNPRLFQNGDFKDAFIIWIEENTDEALERPDGNGYLIGYSRICTHMGCYLVDDGGRGNFSNTDIDLEEEKEGFVCGPCPCHGTSFDLLKSGLVIFGPATQNLPRLKLRLSEDETEVEAHAWLYDSDPREENWPF